MNNKMLVLISVCLCGFSSIGNAGIGGGGGSPPSIELGQLEFMKVQDGAMNGDFIRLTLPDSEPRILKPDLNTLQTSQLEAVDIVDGSVIVLHPGSPNAEKKLSIKRMNESTRFAKIQQPGANESIESKVAPSVVLVPAEEIQSDTSIQISDSDLDDSQPSELNAGQSNENGGMTAPSP